MCAMRCLASQSYILVYRQIIENKTFSRYLSDVSHLFGVYLGFLLRMITQPDYK